MAVVVVVAINFSPLIIAAVVNSTLKIYNLFPVLAVVATIKVNTIKVSTIKVSIINNNLKVNTPNSTPNSTPNNTPNSTPNNILKDKGNFFPLYFVINKKSLSYSVTNIYPLWVVVIVAGIHLIHSSPSLSPNWLNRSNRAINNRSNSIKFNKPPNNNNRARKKLLFLRNVAKVYNNLRKILFYLIIIIWLVQNSIHNVLNLSKKLINKYVSARINDAASVLKFKLKLKLRLKLKLKRVVLPGL